MLNFGLIEEYKGQIKVRVPVNNGVKDQSFATPTKDLPNAIVDSRGKDGYRDGDTVIVGYIYNDTSYPVVLCPYGERTPTAGQRTEKLLRVIDTAELPENTNIGEVSGLEIANIKGLDYLLVEKIEKVEEYVDLKNTSQDAKIDTLQQNIADIQQELGNIGTILDELNGEVI